MKIAVIPARGGSKRIPRKNVRPFAGRPLLCHPLEAALGSGMFEHVVVSSDDEEILDLAARSGASPLPRPAHLADDHAHLLPVVRHAVAWAEARGWPVTAACCVVATAAFLRREDLGRGLQILADTGSRFVFSVVEFPYPIFRGLLRDGPGVKMIHPEHYLTRSQDLPAAFHDAGQFYWGTAEAWRTEDRIFGPRSAPVFLPRHRVQDIDTPEDWEHAEILFRVLAERGRS